MNKTLKDYIYGIILGGVIFSVVGTLAATAVASNTVSYSNSSKTTKTNVKDAIDELYSKLSSTTCPIGYKCVKFESPTLSDTHLGIVYLDPTDLSKKCDVSNSAIGATGTKTGCMKWYIYKDNGSTYNLILDHNTTAKVNGFSAAQTQVNTDTASWVSSLNPRLIIADEIWEITKETNGKSSWSSSTAAENNPVFFEGRRLSGQGTSKYSWLYDYTDRCINFGCDVADSSTSGYWTQNTVVGSLSRWWRVNYDGVVDKPMVSDPHLGIRPVITISKS